MKILKKIFAKFLRICVDFDGLFKEFSLNFGTRKYPGFSGVEGRVSGRVRVLTLRVPGGFGWPKMSGLPVGFSGFGSPRPSLNRISYSFATN